MDREAFCRGVRRYFEERGASPALVESHASYMQKRSWLAPLVISLPILGALGGYSLAKLREANYRDDELQTDELIAEYNRALDQIRRARARAAQLR